MDETFEWEQSLEGGIETRATAGILEGNGRMRGLRDESGEQSTIDSVFFVTPRLCQSKKFGTSKIEGGGDVDVMQETG